jgi:anti-sigma factor RsiW
MTMDDCQRTAARLAPYVDGALPAGEQADLERHLDRCPPCRAAALHEKGARRVLREQSHALTGTPLPPGLRTRCEALARQHARSSAPGFTLGRSPLRRFAPLTAVVTIVIGFFLFSLATHQSDAVLAAQLTADHAKCFRFFANGASPDDDAHRVEQMLNHDYGWDLRVPPSSPATGLHLIGARRCLYADGTVPHVMYRVNGHDVSLYVLDGVTRPGGDLVSFGHRSHIWTAGRRTYVLVWPVAAGEMTAATRYVVAEAR